MKKPAISNMTRLYPWRQSLHKKWMISPARPQTRYSPSLLPPLKKRKLVGSHKSMFYTQLGYVLNMMELCSPNLHMCSSTHKKTKNRPTLCGPLLDEQGMLTFSKKYLYVVISLVLRFLLRCRIRSKMKVDPFGFAHLGWFAHFFMCAVT